MAAIQITVRFITKDGDADLQGFVPATTDTTIEEFKEAIQERWSISTLEQQLSWSRFVLGGGSTRNDDDKRTLGSYGIRDGDTITLAVLVKGGISTPC
jgi:hypothetical protein